MALLVSHQEASSQRKRREPHQLNVNIYHMCKQFVEIQSSKQIDHTHCPAKTVSVISDLEKEQSLRHFKSSYKKKEMSLTVFVCWHVGSITCRNLKIHMTAAEIPDEDPGHGTKIICQRLQQIIGVPLVYCATETILMWLWPACSFIATELGHRPHQHVKIR